MIAETQTAYKNLKNFNCFSVGAELICLFYRLFQTKFISRNI